MPILVNYLVEILLLLFVYWFAMFFSSLIHDLGHALAYTLLTGDSHWHIRIGSGKSILTTQRLTIKWIVFDGLFKPYENRLDTKPKKFLTILAGPLFSILLIVLFQYLRLRFGGFDLWFIKLDSILQLFIFINQIILLSALLPIRYFWGEFKGTESDGLQLIKLIKSMWEK